MFTKAEIKKMGKGFHPSTTHEFGNRKTRRQSNYGLHNLKKGPILKVIGTSKFFCFIQRIYTSTGIKYIEHSILK